MWLCLCQRNAEDLLGKQNQLKDQLSMAVDDVAQVNNIPPMLEELKEVRPHLDKQKHFQKYLMQGWEVLQKFYKL